jgi:hypothetical protein
VVVEGTERHYTERIALRIRMAERSAKLDCNSQWIPRYINWNFMYGICFRRSRWPASTKASTTVSAPIPINLNVNLSPEIPHRVRGGPHIYNASDRGYQETPLFGNRIPTSTGTTGNNLVSSVNPALEPVMGQYLTYQPISGFGECQSNFSTEMGC